MNLLNILNIFNVNNFFGISFSELFIFIAIILATVVISSFFKIFIAKIMRNKKAKTSGNLFTTSIKPLTGLIYVIGFYIACMTLPQLSNSYQIKSIINLTAEIAITVIFTWICFNLVDIFNNYIIKRYKLQSSNDDVAIHFSPLITRTLKIVIAFIATMIIIQHHGYSATSLITGFGITGLAVGFAAKETIANVFESFALIIDKTYKVGDWIIIDKQINEHKVEGIVEDITLRSTKIRAFDNSLLVIANNEIATSIIKNVSKNRKKRIFEYIDITYNTPPEKIEEAIAICKKIVQNNPNLEDYQQIHLNQLGPYSLKIMFYVFTKTTDWAEYLNIRQDLLLNIIKEFNAAGIEFAFPTQTLYINKENA